MLVDIWMKLESPGVRHVLDNFDTITYFVHLEEM